MQNCPKVSVIIPFYKGINWLVQAIESVLAQTYPVSEIILINDGSPTSLEPVLQQFGEAVRYLDQENRGPAAARNAGIDCAQGEYIAFLDADDVWMPQKIEKQMKCMLSSGAFWSHTSYATFLDGDFEKGDKVVDLSSVHGDVFSRLLNICPLATPCVMLKKEILTQEPCLRFLKELRFGEDVAFWLRLAARYPLEVVPEALTRVRIHGDNAALRADVQLKARIAIWDDICKNPNLYMKQSISRRTYFSYGLCKYGNRFYAFMERHCRKTWVLKWTARFCYFLPWILFKTIR